ncbi:MAG: MFS transporter [Mesorhizobium sp.]|nr:MFS transporter [bacterium M00.F.Ca.ET.205.01.1.1]TGU55035.1 MFS transporter [bacterium M00.F.Ca.ET.152.01.1.1]TGV38988.1 MFS transporter [Mesorhizobium sp. M00.F.Ca.ET.186.01.1.1]TGZ44610.1 MFS transporter [bacterium M00.F.Ca.ET.162.01.1.1]TJW31259.1 MAG: MFS transporter [Mesorhizobium sp.]
METTYDSQLVEAPSAWGAVACLSLLTFVLVASEFMPVSLLTPVAHELAITEGQAGQAISVSGFFAVVTSLFGNALLSKLDRRRVVLVYTAILVVSGLAITFAPNYLVFMLGRALIGVSIGGFWSLSTAILARIVSRDDLPKAIAMLQGGTAFASVIAAPLGSFLGGLIGWRGAFFIVVPIGLAAIVWQLAVLPRMPSEEPVSVGRMVGLLGNRTFAIGMAATTLAFMGQFSLSTYLRPFLEGITGLDVNILSMVLLGLGLAGLLGASFVGFILRSHLGAVLVALPAALAIIALLLIALGSFAVATAVLLFLWGLFTTPIPVAWNTWMAKVIPNDLEAGGGLQVALIQFAITFGAFAGGLLFDSAGWWSPFALGALLLLGSTLLSIAAATSTRASHRPQYSN